MKPIREIEIHCEHCESEHDLEMNVPCPYGQGLPHCLDHRGQCARCGDLYCMEALVKAENDELLCSVCYDIEKSALVMAARRAARTGSYKDLKEYLRLRRATAE